ncbi:MAG: hypothetical protein EAZ32_15825 [Cytophagia bacterium]|nr:MAG: hypothetical protein EAZ38_16825 [Cytophagales bacterium]TAG37348.1 MAG: hypothetical protein EAZ32_15825 [Cytophagia bacterium]TAG58357.1 MAG: hypothetical protein EAZ27_01615 [Cytophagales bacterium]TAG78330.1 MAG: hypothetical protein EAZ22_13895 [Cytophagales bacterium]
MEDQKINLNFLRLTQQDFNFIIYRKEYVEAEINEHIHKYSLPQGAIAFCPPILFLLDSG